VPNSGTKGVSATGVSLAGIGSGEWLASISFA